jgi:hypothetical protein
VWLDFQNRNSSRTHILRCDDYPKLSAFCLEMDESRRPEVAASSRVEHPGTYHGHQQGCQVQKEIRFEAAREQLLPATPEVNPFTRRCIRRRNLMRANLTVQMYRPGEEVPKSGIYKVSHCGHHHDHEVTCLSGEPFPECQQCGGMVQFSLLIAAHDLHRHTHLARSEASMLNSVGQVALRISSA